MLPGELDVGEHGPELETLRLDPVELLLHHLVLVRHLPHLVIMIMSITKNRYYFFALTASFSLSSAPSAMLLLSLVMSSRILTFSISSSWTPTLEHFW